MANEFKIKSGIIIDNSIPINYISNDNTLSANSSATLPTQQAIKTYITSVVSSAGGGDMMKSQYASASPSIVDNAYNSYKLNAQLPTYYATSANLNTHIVDYANPHQTTKTQVGLSAVDNTSDLNKPISTATQTALNLKFNTSGINQYATSANLNTHIVDYTNPHQTTKTQVGLSAVDNTSDLNKPISTATQTALNLKFDTSGISNYTTTASFNAHVGSIGSSHGNVTITSAGFMSSADKVKLDSLTSAGAYVLPISTSAVLGGVKAGVANTGITVDGSGILSATSNVAIWNANQIQGRSVSAVAPTNGQALVYSSATNVWTPQTQLSDFRLTFSSPLVLTGGTLLQADSAQSTGGGSWNIAMGHPFPNGGYFLSGYRILLQSLITNNTASTITVQLRTITADGSAVSGVSGASGTLIYTAVIPITVNTGGVNRDYYAYGQTISPILIPDNQMLFAVVSAQTATSLTGCIFHIALSK